MMCGNTRRSVSGEVFSPRASVKSSRSVENKSCIRLSYNNCNTSKTYVSWIWYSQSCDTTTAFKDALQFAQNSYNVEGVFVAKTTAAKVGTKNASAWLFVYLRGVAGERQPEFGGEAHGLGDAVAAADGGGKGARKDDEELPRLVLRAAHTHSPRHQVPRRHLQTTHVRFNQTVSDPRAGIFNSSQEISFCNIRLPKISACRSLSFALIRSEIVRQLFPTFNGESVVHHLFYGGMLVSIKFRTPVTLNKLNGQFLLRVVSLVHFPSRQCALSLGLRTKNSTHHGGVLGQPDGSVSDQLRN